MAANYNLSGEGELRVHDFNGIDWEWRGSIVANDFEERIGTIIQMSSDGGRIIAGDPVAQNGFGVARVFEWNGTDWIKLGNTILGEFNGDRFGRHVAISSSETHIAVRSDLDVNGLVLGEVDIYVLQNEEWTLVGEPIVGDWVLQSTIHGTLDGGSGNAIALTGDATTIAIGAPFNNSSFEDGGNLCVYQLLGELTSDY